MYDLDKVHRGIEPIFDEEILDWYEDLFYELEVQGDMDRSDAQGFQMIRQDATEECYNNKMTPEEAANYLLTKQRKQ